MTTEPHRVQKMNTPREADIPATYVAAIPAADMFADLSYQREPDMTRVRHIAAQWDVRLVGVLEVSDRGEHSSPRYAVVDGHHRMRGAQLLDIAPPLVATVHTGLTIQQEAELFDRLNRERRRLTTWDHWRARTTAGDRTVLAIHKAVAKLDLVIGDAPKPGYVRCTSTLEKLHTLGGTQLVADVLHLLKQAWGRDVTSFDAPLVHGVGLVLHYLPKREPIDVERLTTALVQVEPRLVKTSAVARRDTMTGSAAKLVAVVVMDLYNRTPGKKILVSTRTFGPTARNARSTTVA
jgi:hypothetical protein